MKNIILTGMPGCGKSTAGVILAKTIAASFIDTDLIIQVQQRNTLQRLIELYGIETFLHYEEAALLSVNEKENIVVATGGSAVFSDFAMTHLKKYGVCVFLDVPVQILEKRLSNIKTRGIASKPGETIEDIYNERLPYYRKYADFTIECGDKSVEKIVREITEKLELN